MRGGAGRAPNPPAISDPDKINEQGKHTKGACAHAPLLAARTTTSAQGRLAVILGRCNEQPPLTQAV